MRMDLGASAQIKLQDKREWLATQRLLLSFILSAATFATFGVLPEIYRLTTLPVLVGYPDRMISAIAPLESVVKSFVQDRDDADRAQDLKTSSKSKLLKLKPKKMTTARLRPEIHNGDFLAVVKAPPAEKNLNEIIFDREMSNEMKGRFESFNRIYEAEEPWRLQQRQTYSRYEAANKDLAEWTLKKLLQHHIDTTLKDTLEKSAKRMATESRSSSERGAAQAVVTLTSMHKALKNTSFNLGENTKTSFRYDIPSGLLRVGLVSPLVDANIEYWIRPLRASGVGQLDQQAEKLVMSMNRNFGFLAASTNIRYGLVSETLNYGIQKKIIGPMSAQVDQAHYLKDTSRDETLFRLSFGTSF